jgi:hypothetical protein
MATECPPGCGCGFCLIDRQEQQERPTCRTCGQPKERHVQPDGDCMWPCPPRSWWPGPTYVELEAANARLTARVRELEEALRAVTELPLSITGCQRHYSGDTDGCPECQTERDYRARCEAVDAQVAAALSPAAEGEPL